MINSYADVLTPTAATPVNSRLTNSYQTLLNQQVATAQANAASNTAHTNTSTTNNNANGGGTTHTNTTTSVNTTPTTPTTTPSSCGTHTATVEGGGPVAQLRNLGTRAAGNGKPISVSVGKAYFSLPPVATSNKSVKAPPVKWGAGWTKQTDGTYKHTNGSVARPGKQPRLSVSNPSKISIINTKYGRGQKLPSGDVVGIDKSGVPYQIDSHGNKMKLSFGIHKIGGLTIRAFEATTVNVVVPDGRFMRYDSRGNIRLGSGNGAKLVSGGGPSGSKEGVSQISTDLLGGLTKLLGDLTKNLNKSVTVTTKADPADVKLLNNAMGLIKQLFGTMEGGDTTDELGGADSILGALGGLGQALVGGTNLG